MSCRVDSTLIPGACVVGDRGLGVLGSVIRATTGPSSGPHGAGYLYNDWQDSGDDGKEFRGLIVTPPSAGTFAAYEDGSFSLTGAPDGSYSFVYRLYVDGVDLGTATASITVGNLAASVAGLASVTFSATGGVVVTIEDEMPGAPASPPAILAGPVPAAADEGEAVSFSVDATGTGPLAYTWLLDGAPFAGADGSTLTLLATVLLDGIMVSVRVANSAGSVTSEPVPITVVESASALTAAESRQMFRWLSELASIHGLVPGLPLQVSQARRRSGLLEQSISSANGTTTVARL